MLSAFRLFDVKHGFHRVEDIPPYFLDGVKIYSYQFGFLPGMEETSLGVWSPPYFSGEVLYKQN